MTINEMYTGYCDDYSMSVRARAAYADGERPLSKWTKSAIIAACAALLDGADDGEEKLDALKHHTLSTLKSNLLTYSSWHHTSKMYNCTNFYAINDDTLTEPTPAEIRSWQPTKKNVQQPPTAAITAITDAITSYRSDGYARTILIDPTTGTAYPTPTPPPNHPVYATWDSIAAYADKWLDDPAATPATLATGFVDLYHRDALDALADQLAAL